MLTARGQVVDRVVGMKLADDHYLTKPFAMMELLARIEALLRRSTPSSALLEAGRFTSGRSDGEVLQFGSVCADFRRTVVTRDNKAVNVSARSSNCFAI